MHASSMAHDIIEATPPGGINSEDQNSAPVTTTAFRLLDLPDELVLRVLEFAVVTSSNSKPIRISQYRKYNLEAVQPAITRTCRSLRKEGTPMFYKQNIFFVDSLSHEELRKSCMWLTAIGSKNCALVNQIQVRWTTSLGNADLPEHKRWEDMAHEMRYLQKADLLGADRTACIRFREGRIVLGTGALAGCYQMMWRCPDGAFENGWTSVVEFLDVYQWDDQDQVWEVEQSRLESKDFWTYDT